MRSLAPSLLLVVAACNSPPGDLRTWRAEDHDHTTNPGQDQVVGGPDAGPAPELARVGLDEVTVIAWKQNCTRCHGAIGRGDGPQGALVHATDLTNPKWQRSVTDEQIAATIKNGRGSMPPFALPDATIQSLVHLVRLLDASKLPAAAGDDTAAPDDSAAPAGSAAPVKSAAPSSAKSAAPGGAKSAAPVRSAAPPPAPSAR
jgi:mono/diheme cytochrome c family protein